MYYWNRGNFEGLSALSQQLDAHPNLAPLANYCRFRNKGLRRDALTALEHFLAKSRTFDSASARSAAVEILELNARTPKAHQFLTQPLKIRFLIPTLQAWIDGEPAASTPVRWLGILTRGAGLLEKALFMSPEDIPVRKLLIELDIAQADYATHHLDETLFVGSVAEVFAALAHARHLLDNAPQAEPFSHLASEVQEFDAQLADWIVFSKNPVGTFPEWCAAQGRTYAYCAKYYNKQ